MENLKKWIPFLVITLVLIGGYYFFSNGQAEEESEVKEEISNEDVMVQELADKYQTTVGWDESSAYTLEMQEQLITGKPAVFRGFVDDIFERDGKLIVRISSPFLSYYDFVAELECNRTIVDGILAQNSNGESYSRFYEEYAVVANIQEVSRPVFSLEGSALSEEEVEIDAIHSNLFSAKGTCLDIVYLGNGGLFD